VCLLVKISRTISKSSAIINTLYLVYVYISYKMYFQVINYGEYLPNVLGDYQMRKYGLYLEYGFPRGEKNMYDANLDATASNVFGTAAFRFGHSEIAFGTQPKNK